MRGDFQTVYEYQWLLRPGRCSSEMFAKLLAHKGNQGWRAVHWTNVGVYLERRSEKLRDGDIHVSQVDDEKMLGGTSVSDDELEDSVNVYDPNQAP